MEKRFTRPITFILFLFALILPTGWAVAGALTENPAISVLDTIVVTADRSEDTLRETPQNVTVVSGNDIRRSASTSLVDILKRQGIQVFWTGSGNYGSERLVMRGGKSSMNGFDLSGDILLLVDGRRAGTDSFAGINLESIDRIEIIRGPGAVQYGSAAVGGVVNVITKRGEEIPAVRLEAGLGSYNTQKYSSFASGMAGPFDISAWGNYLTAGDYTDGNGDKHLYSGLNYRTQYGMNAGWNFSENNRLGVSFNGMTGNGMEMGEKGSSTYKNQRQNRDYYLGDIIYEGSSDTANISWMGRYYLGKTTTLLNRESTRAASFGERADSSDAANKMQGGQAQISWEGADWFKLTGGIDVLRYSLEQHQPFSIHTSQTMANHTSSEYLNVGSFLIGKLYLMKERNLILSAGARYDYFDVKADTVKAPETPSERHLHSSSTINNFIPSVGLAYSPLEVLKLRANYSHSFRMPTPRELGGLFAMSGNTTFVGNPDLDPEKSKSWDIGFDLAWDALDLSVTYFDIRYKDKITALAAGSVPGSPRDRPFVNLDRAYVEGIEIYFSYDIGYGLDLPFSLAPYLSWTHLGSYRDSDRKDLSDTAEDSIAWGVNLKSAETGTDVSLDFVYYGETKSAPSSAGVQEVYPGGATVADLTINQRVARWGSGSELKIKVAVKNIFDKYYTTYQEDYMFGRNFYTGFVYTY